jgi:hypothetical protein
MRKKMIDQKTEPAIVAIASGYTMNTRPGPATSAQCTEHSKTETTCRNQWLLLSIKEMCVACYHYVNYH